MNFQEYQQIIKDTAIYPKDYGKGYCTLGIIEELEELEEALLEGDIENILSERGDVLWYLTALCNEYNFDLYAIITNIEYQKYPMSKVLGILAGRIKKTYRDNTDYSEIVKSCISTIYHYINVPGIDIMSKNVEKIYKRRETKTLHGDGSNREKL